MYKEYVLGFQVGMYEIEVMKDYQIVRIDFVEIMEGNSHATLVKSCFAKCCIWLLGKGTN